MSYYKTRAEALRLHGELMQALPPGEALNAVVQLHAPLNGPYDGVRVAECGGCDMGDHAEGAPIWPCTTIKMINQYAHVDEIGYPE